jgi:hypothetical protein
VLGFLGRETAKASGRGLLVLGGSEVASLQSLRNFKETKIVHSNLQLNLVIYSQGTFNPSFIKPETSFPSILLPPLDHKSK